jgi:hypothetical protein
MATAPFSRPPAMRPEGKEPNLQHVGYVGFAQSRLQKSAGAQKVLASVTWRTAGLMVGKRWRRRCSPAAEDLGCPAAGPAGRKGNPPWEPAARKHSDIHSERSNSSFSAIAAASPSLFEMADPSLLRAFLSFCRDVVVGSRGKSERADVAWAATDPFF